ncbi:MAG: hypothetical protein LBC96_09695 [Lachnospiraceae bacterium]|jgi:hypothetical protein|nr:hypothetical protein [Lachnospiraceae bacterium]
MLIIIPRSGLASRIITICDAYELAKKFKRKLIILWVMSSDCNIGYHYVFAKEQFADICVKVIEFKRFSYHLRGGGVTKIGKEVSIRLWCYLSYSLTYFYYKFRSKGHHKIHDNNNYRIDSSFIRDNESCMIKAFCGFCGEYDLKNVSFRDDLIHKANEIMNPYQGKCIGVHIRRTDHLPAKSNSLTSDFEEKISSLLANDEELFFYVAADDIIELRNLQNEYGERIVCQTDAVQGRDSEAGMISAVIDIICLSMTNYIIGSYQSVFSKFAATLGNIELII